MTCSATTPPPTWLADPRVAGYTQHWACVLRSRGTPAFVSLPGSGEDQRWTSFDRQLIQTTVDALIDRKKDLGEVRGLVERLAQQRLAPIEQLLSKWDGLPPAKNLVVLTRGMMAGVPVQALVDLRAEGRRDYVVSYAPSGTIFTWLTKQQQASSTSSGFFAIADPSDDLPAARGTAQLIARMFPDSELLVGKAVNAAAFQELAEGDALRRYKYLHLAMHCVANEAAPMQSELVWRKSESDVIKGILAGKSRVLDGRITARQVARTWALNADLVTLSACESNLGVFSPSEGYLGFCQALFIAGANKMVLTQWPVSDRASALLLMRFYQNLTGKRAGLDQPVPTPEALAEAKRWVRGLSAQEASKLLGDFPDNVRGKMEDIPVTTPHQPYEHPYYWAGFVLVGGN